MRRFTMLAATLGVLLSALAADPARAATPATSADLIIHHANIWTVDDSQPQAQAVAIKDGRIARVGSNKEVLRLKGADTRLLDMQGKLVLPGLIDGHTHFENATDWFFEARVIDVNDEALLLERLAETAARVPQGMWITGYDWSAFAASAAKRKGDTGFQPLTPSLAAVDRITPDHPVLLRRYDGSYFMNSRALALTRITRNSPNPSNGEYARDPRTGELTGMVHGSAGERMVLTMPPKSRARTLVAARQLMKELNRHGITSIHDIARVDELSQKHIYHTNVERSNSDLSIFTDLRRDGDLSVRVYPILTMANWRDYTAFGITPSTGDELIHYGALKAFVDGFYMEKPYLDNPNNSGGLTFRVVDEASMQEDVVGADRLGFDPAVHVIGDKAHRLLLDWYEAAIAANPPRDRRFRLIHSWFPAEKELDRAARIGMIMDITPFHLIREVKSMDHRLGPERVKTAFAWRSMIDKGLRLSIVSDWPGSFDRGNLAPLNPFENMYYAIARQYQGQPVGGWHPEQGLTIQEAIRAYTINPAYSAREEAIKGSITEGKLADLVVLSDNILQAPTAQLLKTQVLYTIFGGRVVYQADGQTP